MEKKRVKLRTYIRPLTVAILALGATLSTSDTQASETRQNSPYYGPWMSESGRAEPRPNGESGVSGEAGWGSPGYYTMFRHPVPRDFDQYMVFVASGQFDPSEPHPTVPGCGFASCDGNYFQEELMGRDEGEIEQVKGRAVEFFNERYGLDVLALQAAGRVLFQSFMVDPRVDYRLVSMGHANVGSRGWTVHDGGYRLIVLDPTGLELGGEYAGMTIPPFSMMIDGEYKIDVGNSGLSFNIDYQSAEPIFADAWGRMTIGCELDQKWWGAGVAQGIAQEIRLDDGRVKMNIRNVLTFSPYGSPEN